MTHHLKTVQPYFTDIKYGRKQFECRKDDRNFQVGDRLVLEEYCPQSGATGNRQPAIVTYKLTGEAFGILPGFCVLGIQLD